MPVISAADISRLHWLVKQEIAYQAAIRRELADTQMFGIISRDTEKLESLLTKLEGMM